MTLMACPGKNIKFSKDFSLLNQMFIVKKGVFLFLKFLKVALEKSKNKWVRAHEIWISFQKPKI